MSEFLEVKTGGYCGPRPNDYNVITMSLRYHSHYHSRNSSDLFCEQLQNFSADQLLTTLC